VKYAPRGAGRRDLGYRFTPVPRTAFRAVAEGDLSYDAFAILAWFYDRAQRGSNRVSFTLDQLRTGVRWTRSEDWLYRRVRELRSAGWISYDATPGQHAHAYDATLHPTPDPPEKASEQGPSSETAQHEADATASPVEPEESPPSSAQTGPTSTAAESEAAPTVGVDATAIGSEEPRTQEGEQTLGYGDKGVVTSWEGEERAGQRAASDALEQARRAQIRSRVRGFDRLTPNEQEVIEATVDALDAREIDESGGAS
jgi:hypothetical protein